MRLSNRHLRYDLAPGPRFQVKGYAAALVAVMFLVLGTYLYFSPGFGTYFPVSCNLPSGPFYKEPLPSQLNESANDKSSVSATASQEIWDFSAENDSLLSVLKENLTDETEAPEIARSMTAVISAELARPFDGETKLKDETRYNVTVDQEGRFLKATLELAPDKVFHCVRSDSGLRSWKENVVLDFRVENITFKMTGTLEESVLRAGEGKLLASELANVFKYDIDFRYESIRGDVCRVVFERRYADDRPSGYGRILYAVYQGKKTHKTAIWFDYKGKYYDERGCELEKDLIRSPLKHLHLLVTSRFGNRIHPIFHRPHHHKGVDYGAPIGTLVVSVAPGVVTFAGWQNGYGRYVCIKHPNGCESRYGHLSRFAVQKGDRVARGAPIGRVGMTGDATGPHLHFELLVGNVHKNPQKFVATSIRSVPELLRDRFAIVKRQVMLSDNVPIPPAPVRTSVRSQLVPPNPRSGKVNGRDA